MAHKLSSVLLLSTGLEGLVVFVWFLRQECHCICSPGWPQTQSLHSAGVIGVHHHA